MSDIVIPRFKPEKIALEARKEWNGDDEKVPTTPLKYLVVDGVHLASRYNKAHEYEDMAAMVKGVDISLRPYIGSIVCDSKATSCYEVALKPCSTKQAKLVSEQIKSAAIRKSGGFNVIYVSGANGGHIIEEAYWIGDYD